MGYQMLRMVSTVVWMVMWVAVLQKRWKVFEWCGGLFRIPGAFNAVVILSFCGVEITPTPSNR
jgi:hypothetical protein